MSKRVGVTYRRDDKVEPYVLLELSAIDNGALAIRQLHLRTSVADRGALGGHTPHGAIHSLSHHHRQEDSSFYTMALLVIAVRGMNGCYAVSTEPRRNQ